MPKAIPIAIVAAGTGDTIPALSSVPSAHVSRRYFLQGSVVLTGLLLAGTPIAWRGARNGRRTCRRAARCRRSRRCGPP